ncbi:ABC transporter substrate-binding protein [Paenibacillus sp. IITD108]|uniref:ABC transporter substrate-binding protein n=1 Tax=Paenibacillus sp. IITD108 TaxID=3116649 RepID=UPI002F42C09C
MWKNKKWNKRMLLSLLAVILTAMLAACGAGSTNQPSATPSSSSAASTPETTASPTPDQEAETAYPLTLKDSTGFELTFEKAPAKVVSILSSETEILYAIGAGEQVVGVDDFSNYPPEALEKPKVGDVTTNIEAVLALEPDLVLASSTMNTAAVEQLRALNINVYATDPKTYDEVAQKIELIGKIMNKQNEAAAVAGHMLTVKSEVTDKIKDAAKKSVFFDVSDGWTVGSGEFIDELISLAGGSNIAAEQQGWFEADNEMVIKHNPDVILFSSYGGDTNALVDGIAARSGWDAIEAVKNKAIFPINEDLVSRVGPRLADALQAMSAAVHPELFEAK